MKKEKKTKKKTAEPDPCYVLGYTLVLRTMRAVHVQYMIVSNGADTMHS